MAKRKKERFLKLPKARKKPSVSSSSKKVKKISKAPKQKSKPKKKPLKAKSVPVKAKRPLKLRKPQKSKKKPVLKQKKRVAAKPKKRKLVVYGKIRRKQAVKKGWKTRRANLVKKKFEAKEKRITVPKVVYPAKKEVIYSHSTFTRITDILNQGKKLFIVYSGAEVEISGEDVSVLNAQLMISESSSAFFEEARAITPSPTLFHVFQEVEKGIYHLLFDETVQVPELGFDFGFYFYQYF